MVSPLLALTLWRPWPFAIFHLPEASAKRVENRPWKPWPSVIGERIALHAGKQWDKDAAMLIGVAEEFNPPSVIVGTAVVKGWIHVSRELLLVLDADVGRSETLTHADAVAHSKSPWFSGPYAWVLEEVRTLKTPIPCKGAQGLWRVPADVCVQIEAQEATNG